MFSPKENVSFATFTCGSDLDTCYKTHEVKMSHFIHLLHHRRKSYSYDLHLVMIL